jgi:ABC-type lipoprotein release transport system permease subunit
MQQSVFPYLRKYVLPLVIISAFTVIGVRFGMTTFIVTGSLMIGATLLLRLYKK